MAFANPDALLPGMLKTQLRTDEDLAQTIQTEAGVDWKALSGKLPVGTDMASTAERRRLFKLCDISNNGLISLYEFDQGLALIFGADYHAVIAKAKPATIRAFQAAKVQDHGTSGAAKRSKASQLRRIDDDYVSWSEFRVLLAFLRQYLELWQMFQLIDGGETGDRRLSLDEFREALPHLERWGWTGDPETEFKVMDADSSGYVRFDEFAKWAMLKNLDLEDDDETEEVDDLVKNMYHGGSRAGARKEAKKAAGEYAYARNGDISFGHNPSKIAPQKAKKGGPYDSHWKVPGLFHEEPLSIHDQERMLRIKNDPLRAPTPAASVRSEAPPYMPISRGSVFDVHRSVDFTVPREASLVVSGKTRSAAWDKHGFKPAGKWGFNSARTFYETSGSLTSSIASSTSGRRRKLR